MTIKLKNVRLSFPSLFSTSFYAGDDTGKYDATFILDKKEHAAAIKEIQAEAVTLCKETLKVKNLPPDRICLKDGDETEREELHGKMHIKASTKKRPLVIGKDKTPLTEEDEVIYAGCYVNAIISLWAQDNQYGKRINAQLDGVQFWKNGEPFGSSGIEANEFDAFGDPPEEDIPF
jgi:hypothetical protein